MTDRRYLQTLHQSTAVALSFFINSETLVLAELQHFLLTERALPMGMTVFEAFGSLSLLMIT